MKFRCTAFVFVLKVNIPALYPLDTRPYAVHPLHRRMCDPLCVFLGIALRSDITLAYSLAYSRREVCDGALSRRVLAEGRR